MPAAISAVRWAAAHALMRGEPPTQERVSAAMGIHVTTFANHKRKEGWVLLDFRRQDLLAAHAALWEQLIERFLLGSADAPEPPHDEPSIELGAAQVGADAEMAAEPTLDEQIARVGRVLSRQIDRLLAAADAAGALSKPQVDMLNVIMRLAEKFGALASEHAADKQTRSDDELADILRRVDARIIHLARGLARRMAARKADA